MKVQANANYIVVGASALGFRGLPRFLGLPLFFGGRPRLLAGCATIERARSLILSLISIGKAVILFLRFSAEINTSDIKLDAFLLGIFHLKSYGITGIS